MSWDPRDYDGATFESEERERAERRAVALQERDEREALEMAFEETPACDKACFETLLHQHAERLTITAPGERRAA